MNSRPLRLLFIASYFPKPDNPQMGTWALEQAKALVRNGAEVLVISFTSAVPTPLALTTGAQAYANCPAEHVWDGDVRVLYPQWLYYPIEPVKSWMYANPQLYLKLASLSARKQLSKHIERFSPDLLFCHHSLPNGWVTVMQPESEKIPIITFDHDYSEVSDCWKHPQRRQAMQTVADKAWAMLSVSERMSKDIHSIFPTARRLATHSIGVNLPLSVHLNRARSPELQTKTIVLCCALFAERKGIALLVQAFCRVAPRYPKAILRIIGGGPEENNIKAVIAHYDKNGQVQLLGKKKHAEVLQEMCWADCFALVSWDEPLGAVYLEAMAAGKPIICGNDGGINETIMDGVHGYAVVPKQLEAAVEALEKMLSNPDERQAMGKRSRQLIKQKMTWDVRAKDLLNLFDEAVSVNS